MYDEYKLVTKLKYDFSLSFIFVILPAMAEGIPAVVPVDPIVGRFNTVTERRFVIWMVTSTSILS